MPVEVVASVASAVKEAALPQVEVAVEDMPFFRA